MNVITRLLPCGLALSGVLAVSACTGSAPAVAHGDEASSVHDARATTAITYPKTARGDVTDDYHGTRVADPYRWLEDPDAPDTRRWIEAQNEVTRAWIDAVPERAAIEARLTELWNYERFGLPFEEGGQWFFSKNDGLKNQSVWYTATALDAPPRVLLDPNALRADGTMAVVGQEVSRDGKLFAYELSEGGSDWTTIRVRDVATGKDLEDVVEWAKFSGIAWSPDSKGFWYSTYPTHDKTGKVALKNQRVQYHALGTPQSKDRLVYAADDQPEWGFNARMTDDGALLVISQREGSQRKNRIFVQPWEPSRPPRAGMDSFEEGFWTPLFDRFDAEYDLLGKKGSRLWFRTDKDAPKGRIVAVDLGVTPKNGFDEVVPESENAIERALFAGDRLFVTYLVDAVSRIQVFELDGKLGDVPALPGLGSVAAMEGSPDSPLVFWTWTSFDTPPEVWRYDVASKKAQSWRKPRLAFDPRDYQTERVFFHSKDGTRVPMFITHRRGVAPTKDTPTFLYGYGGFNQAIKPSFSAASLAWMERGGTYASVNLRGGSEYGRAWHESGTKERKQNVFDDFISAAEWLIAKNMTSPAKLAIHGRSNGGLLVGACMTQRPDLFGAALPGVGVLDMLRYHHFSAGNGWRSDYGRSDDPLAFRWLYAYSPLHNVKQGVRYPATLITTGDHDDRVVPAHSFKFAAALQAAQAPDGPPILIRIETRGGHGAGKPTKMQIEEWSDVLAFLVRVLGDAVRDQQ
jgi:prolyl oligopeptidase